MRRDAGVASSPDQRLALLQRNVIVRPRVPKTLAQPEINRVNDVRLLAAPHQEVLWFDVAMDIVFEMDVFKIRDELISQHQNCF